MECNSNEWSMKFMCVNSDSNLINIWLRNFSNNIQDCSWWWRGAAKLQVWISKDLGNRNCCIIVTNSILPRCVLKRISDLRNFEHDIQVSEWRLLDMLFVWWTVVDVCKFGVWLKLEYIDSRRQSSLLGNFVLMN